MNFGETRASSEKLTKEIAKHKSERFPIIFTVSVSCSSFLNCLANFFFTLKSICVWLPLFIAIVKAAANEEEFLLGQCRRISVG